MKRKKILWLASWYPNRNDWFDGDFIQRHARAAAIFHDVHVIFLTPGPGPQDKEEVISRATGLTEQVIYYRQRRSVFSKLANHFFWKKTFIEAVEKYISQHGRPDIIHVHVPWKAGIIALHFKSAFDLPYIVTEHWGIYNEQVSDNFSRQPFYVKRYIRQVVAEAQKVITVSKYAGKCMKRFLGIRDYQIIPNVVDSTLFTPKEKKYSRFSFIHVSNMAALKNAGQILEAFSHFLKRSGADAQLIMVGNRDDSLKNLPVASGLLNNFLFFRGEVSYREVAEEMGLCHCFVIYSDTETFSCVTAEALCSGLPVIAAQTGALPELVHPENGILVEPSSPEALSRAMEEIFNDYNKFAPAKIAAEAREKFNYSAIAEQFNQLYMED